MRDYTAYEDMDAAARNRNHIQDRGVARQLRDVLIESHDGGPHSLRMLDDDVEGADQDRLARIVDTRDWFQWDETDHTKCATSITDAGREAYEADQEPDAHETDVEEPWFLKDDPTPPGQDADRTEVTRLGDD